MDTNDINKRMERVYLSLGQRFDKNIVESTNIEHLTNGSNFQVKISFGGENKAELYNQAFTIISNIAKLKDHLKNIHQKKGGNKQDIEKEINLSEHLKLIIDLDNQEKHGELKESRSNKFPYLNDIDRALSMRSDEQSKNGAHFTLNPFNGECEYEGNLAIVIIAEVKAKDGTIICSFDELITKSMDKWEEIIKKYNLL